MGERAAAFFRVMSQAAAPRSWSAQARQILLLRERYTTAELDLALGHAASYGALDIASIERILAMRATPRTLDEYVAEDTARRIEQTLGHVRTEPRDLTEYDRLPLTRAQPTAAQETTPCPSEKLTFDTQMPTASPRDCADTSSSSD
jgi:hypothetical protein